VRDPELNEGDGMAITGEVKNLIVTKTKDWGKIARFEIDHRKLIVFSAAYRKVEEFLSEGNVVVVETGEDEFSCVVLDLHENPRI